MKARYILALAILGASLTVASQVHGATVPDCGGNQKQITVPPDYACQQVRTISGFTLTATVEVTAQGHVTVTYTLDKPAPVAFPIRVRWHDGISSGPLATEVSGTFQKGATSAVLTLDKLGCGQLDVKAVFVGNGDERGRVVAPYICVTQTAPATTTIAPTTTSATSVPASTVVPSPTVPGAPSPTPAASSRAALPATGGPYGLLAFIALMVIAFGVLLCRRFNRVNSDV
jgi:hypothetical protein